MDGLKQRMAYLRGLTESQELGGQVASAKVLTQLVQMFDELYNEVRSLHTRIYECEVYMEAVDEDLSDLECLLYDDEDYDETVARDYQEAMAWRDHFSDLDDDEGAYLYETVGPNSSTWKNDSMHVQEMECPGCHEIFLVREQVDSSGYYSYKRESKENQQWNPS
ncbi:CD1247 N-terminal domain-containing protein [Brevibacillus daliensis]|uniref:CD1247 N-terminal domain-containing protein n=1 Tax=Brevibacillus daliensis TaxID=2892995 RepID=UPI001E2CC34F|nr:CD1247 N-terminal domain-containing protein [Brevibacillus daliensis]